MPGTASPDLARLGHQEQPFAGAPRCPYPLCFIGIDVAKATLDVAVRPTGETWHLANEPSAVAALLPRLVALHPTLMVLEATGGFEHVIVAAVAAAGLPVVVANPRQVRDFGRAVGQLAKTDRIDAALLALFAERVRPEPRPLPDERLQRCCGR